MPHAPWPTPLPQSRLLSLTVSPLVASATLWPDSRMQGYTLDTTVGRFTWDISEVGGAHLTVWADGYQTVQTRCLLPEGSNELPWGEPNHEQAIPMVLEPATLPRLEIRGTQFYADGLPWIWKGCSDFLLFQRYLHGEDIEPRLSERRALGANLLRVFGMATKIGQFDPRRYGDYYAHLSEFAARLATQRLYLEFVAYADEQELHVGPWHFAQCVEALRGRGLIELCNEYPKNGIDPTKFTRPTGLLASAGSALSDRPPKVFWDFFGWHGRRDWPKLSNVEDMYVVLRRQRVPAIHDEPIGAAEVDQPGRRTTSILAMKTIASNAARLGSGATFHSEAGLRSEPFGPRTTACAKAFYEALT